MIISDLEHLEVVSQETISIRGKGPTEPISHDNGFGGGSDSCSTIIVYPIPPGCPEPEPGLIVYPPKK